ncbi:SWIM zinc finger family protein [Xanthocytophaga flava]|uniref:SWIM zinc finger family protein n=1 Tax=Xanthocytophaga flava TaxID=3048013 RepID=UPI0028D52A2F|nr:SWIM zinc finger family protein [Xanthocytophaga flavus]MDJ1470040.1 SWIM zinc finger family protein [Xanthocytophaga flavus]
MTNDLAYHYSIPSTVQRIETQTNIFLSHYNEDAVKEVSCFFWGKLKEPYLTAKCLTTLSKVVRSRFALSPQEIAAMRDPIVTAGAGKMRFEAFSSCNGIYARLDILPEGLDGEFLSSGTTNVDFNEPMINALTGILKQDEVFLSVGQKEVILEKQGEQVVERKVTLPTRWIKGLTSVQLYLAEMDEVCKLTKLQTIQLFQTLPKGTIRTAYYLTMRAGKAIFTPASMDGAIMIGGLHRVRLLEGLLPFIDNFSVYATPDRQASAFVLSMGALRFIFSLSADPYRGFSGEGNVLDNLTDNIPLEWIRGANHLLKANEEFNPTLFSLENDIEFETVESLCPSLSAMGLLGYDLTTRQHFYRRLPYKPERIASLNPRLKNARKLIEKEEIELLIHTPTCTEARVKGTNVWHTVLIDEHTQRCTCQWFTDYQGMRGPCKHILSVRILTENMEASSY